MRRWLADAMGRLAPRIECNAGEGQIRRFWPAARMTALTNNRRSFDLLLSLRMTAIFEVTIPYLKSEMWGARLNGYFALIRMLSDDGWNGRVFKKLVHTGRSGGIETALICRARARAGCVAQCDGVAVVVAVRPPVGL